ncbi:DNA-binding GntR family transcriptional regulator [Labrenzia sp. EL_208]|nr:DNA-binding GntR family transcriptional regulator [Labrenzia sp. EL_162]MBG6161589.1 DNA-binding GntR family transcriptional regulator [Labrenzia sp. EL_195]MBG6175174.1 DNA-binding GntR family transcriptional regulator [Labrenzia sp. EL_132]MBG6193566.1 DNA-binding GntR family transcriptional regulator [Labrenzia sp. EL_159]MBG6199936.1 DNA-binding GntR family transcriptional regulator [Labrenzia sp. EL_13]MBG6207482.1 DNA-binding GntR family transcriptional regulator [Labrenzia sp. EL_126
MLNEVVIDTWLDDTVAIAPQVRRIMRERIVKNDLPPGSKLSEAEIAKSYGISRQPVREAFIKLAEEGLLLIRPQRSTLVTKIDYPTVLQSRFVREAVEADIVRLLAQDPQPALVQELRSQLRNQAKIGKTSSADFINEDEIFHRTLAEAAGKDVAWQFVEGLKSQMDRVRFLSFELFPIATLIKQHTAIVDQIEAGNPDTASRAMREHLNEILKTLPQIIQRNQIYFDRCEDLATDGSPFNRE